MKKPINCLLIIFPVIFFFLIGCDLNLKFPKEIVIVKETPELRFKTGMDEIDINALFGNLNFNLFDGDVKILDCVNFDNMTNLVYVKLFDKDLADDPVSKNAIEIIQGLMIAAGKDSHYIDSDYQLIGDSRQLEKPALTGSLSGFKIDPLKARIYISGPNQNFLNALAVEFALGGTAYIFENSPASGLDGVSEYTGTFLPPSRLPAHNQFEIPLDNDLSITFNIYIKGNQTVYASWLNDLDVKVELAVWFPFEFSAGPGGVTIVIDEINDLFTAGGDLFDRENADDKDTFFEYINNVNLEIVLNKNPFSNAALLIMSPGFGGSYIQKNISSNIINFWLDKSELGYPFIPFFSVKLNEGDRVIVPRRFIINEFAFKANISYEADISELTGGWSW